jgi:hypothetical protein
MIIIIIISQSKIFACPAEAGGNHGVEDRHAAQI